MGVHSEPYPDITSINANMPLKYIAKADIEEWNEK
jgi:hypothetical protein